MGAEAQSEGRPRLRAEWPGDWWDLGGLQGSSENQERPPFPGRVCGAGAGGRAVGTLEGARAVVLNLGCWLQRCTEDPSLEVGMGD